ncbi:hypothetical protein RCH12_003375 [Cryobacterium sp. MP_3.1]|uniref:DCL family protein n=1 Tax=Cryobacterium sp. MP_3.1 TaxID=3071711 RepID=UPI002E0BF2BC|nr:hypothetical protein [Cryobacterium sp. MP_3.1]
MAKSKEVVGATLTWPSRIAAEAECLAILRDPRYADGTPIDDERHVLVLTEILGIHQNAEVKAGVGVRHFYVGNNKNADGVQVAEDSIGIWIRRTDKSTTEFSYIESIYPSDHEKKVADALRAAIEDLRYGYRQTRFSAGGAVLSDKSGEAFSSRAAACVVYENPAWSQLVYRFAESEGGADNIELLTEKGNDDAYVGDALHDPAVRERWREFYLKYARPLLMTRSEQSRRPKKIDKTAWRPDR